MGILEQNLKNHVKKGLLLWDIDGTLARRTIRQRIPIHFRALDSIYSSVPQTELTGLSDWEVLNHYAELLGHKDKEFIRRAFQKLDELQSEEKENSFSRCEGISEDLFRQLQTNWTNGILTGNSKYRSNFKLNSIKLQQFFDLNYSFTCEVGDDRPRILERALGRLGTTFTKIVIVGDTPNDIKTARKFEVKVAAISTGKFQEWELLLEKPDALFKNLAVDRVRFEKFLHTQLHLT
jgi:phosphoglycolate phosphatase-like HAD superfamily hydrolase